jgi:hypothetical protein
LNAIDVRFSFRTRHLSRSTVADILRPRRRRRLRRVSIRILRPANRFHGKGRIYIPNTNNTIWRIRAKRVVVNAPRILLCFIYY